MSPKSVDTPPHFAPVIGRKKVPMAPPGPPHASSGARQPSGALPAFRYGIGPAAARPHQGRPEWRSFTIDSGKALIKNAGNRVPVGMAEYTRIHPAMSGKVRILD